MAKTEIESKPYGWLGRLYDSVATKTNNPIEEIKIISQKALEEGVIDERRYIVLQHRVPFQGIERKTLKDLSDRLGTSRQRIKQLEFSIYFMLMRYYLKWN